ncbi:MAG: hypothetical protein PHU85_16620 [Phycisphaerae bacterium]|nr:hypothetical protein [Phycisphaerae bacterium]
MGTQTIERSQWPRFCQRFTDLHQRWAISLDKSGHDGLTVSGVKLVSVELRGRDDDTAFAVTYRVPGESFDQTYLLRQPTKVQVERTGDEADQTLIVQSDKESLTIAFLVTAPAEVLNGIT